MRAIIARILAETGLPGLFDALADGLAPSDLQSLLLAVYQRRARAVTDAQILASAGRALMPPSTVDARLLNAFDRIAFEAAKDFEAVELSPVCPLGTESVLGRIDQNNILTTIRNAEVLGDSTPAMALECARRRGPGDRRKASLPVRLCSSHRVVRLQPFDVPGFTPHFRLFALVTAGRGNAVTIQEHVRVYLNLFRGLNAAGFSMKDPLVEISDMEAIEAVLAEAGISREDVAKSVRAHIPGSGERFLKERGLTLPAAGELAEFEETKAEFPEAEFCVKPDRLEGFGYYHGLCLRISPRAPDGVRYPVVDGGFTDWTARLLQDRKERLLISGIGSELVCRLYRASTS